MTRLSNELAAIVRAARARRPPAVGEARGPGAPGVASAGAARARRAPAAGEARGPAAPGAAPAGAATGALATPTVARLDDWEQVLIAVVDPRSPRLTDRERTLALLEHALRRAGVEPQEFWDLDRARRGRLFLQIYGRPSRDVPSLELSAFDIDKLLKERFRREPLTVGAAWHHGYWRSYFSHAAITHPANDGLREELNRYQR